MFLHKLHEIKNMACEVGKNNFWPASVQIPGIPSQKIKWSVPRTSQLSITNGKIPSKIAKQNIF